MEERLQNNEEPTGELKRLRDKSGKDELSGELKRSLLGGVSRADVMSYVDKLKEQWSSAEQTYKTYIADLAREKETLRLERDELENRVNEQLVQLQHSREAADPLNHPQVLELCEQARSAEAALRQARAEVEATRSQRAELQEQLERLVLQDQEQQIRLRALADQREEEQNREAQVRFQQQAAQYEATIAELNGRLSDQLYELSDATARIEELVREAERREAALGEQTQAQDHALHAALEEAQRQAQQQEAALQANADAEIAQLRSALDEAQQQEAALQANAETEIAQLRETLEEAQRYAGQREAALLANAEAETAQLREALEEAQRYAGLREAALLANADTETAQLREALEEAQRQAGQREAALANAGAEATQLRAALEETQRQAQQREAALVANVDGETAQLRAALEESRRRAEQREAAFVANASAEITQLRASLERRLQEVETALNNTRVRAAQLEQQAYEASLEAQRVGRERDEARGDAEGARAALQAQLQKIQEAHALNNRLKETLSSLLVKAEALIRENDLLGGQLRTERERATQYQTIHERLVDVIARVRMANQLLSERVAEVDRAMGYGAPMPRSMGVGMGMPPPAASSRRLSMEPLNLDGGGTALYDMLQELNGIQTTLNQMQTAPMSEEDKKSTIRYTMEKLAVDCQPKKEDEMESFRVMGMGEHNQKNRA